MLRIQRSAARAIAGVLAGTSLNEALESTWKREGGLAPSERGAIQDICYGTLRHLGTLRAVLRQLAPKPSGVSELDCLLLASMYQLRFTRAAAYAIVDHAVDCARAIGGARSDSFINAVLRNFQRRGEELFTQARSTGEGRYSHPSWWIDRVRHEFGPQADAVLDCANEHPPMTLRVNARRSDPERYLRDLAAASLDARRLDNGGLLLARPVSVDRLPGFDRGEVSVQDAGAQLAAPLLDVEEGMRVLDACAAPGGKTAHVLELVDARMTALDVDGARLQRVRSNLDRLGLDATLQRADAADLEAWWDGTGFDRVLVDAPCSGSGVVRRHPDIKWLRRPDDIPAFAAQQWRLLDALWKVLARGGKLLYVTCSIFDAEDRATIQKFVSRQRDARIVGGMPGSDGLLLPDHEHDGFYYALLRKD